NVSSVLKKLFEPTLKNSIRQTAKNNLSTFSSSLFDILIFDILTEVKVHLRLKFVHHPLLALKFVLFGYNFFHSLSAKIFKCSLSNGLCLSIKSFFIIVAIVRSSSSEKHFECVPRKSSEIFFPHFCKY